MDRDRQMRRLFGVLHHAGVTDRDDRLRLYQFVVCRPVGSTNDLTGVEIDAIAQAVESWVSADPNWFALVIAATEAE
jgi:hypothetical protein